MTSGGDNPDGEREVLCSGCLEIAPESHIHVIPYFNETVGRFVTTYRCNGCWQHGLAETRARLEATDDDAEIASAADVFERHGVIIHEHRRGDPAPVVRQILIRLISMLASGVMQLAIGAVAS